MAARLGARIFHGALRSFTQGRLTVVEDGTVRHYGEAVSSVPPGLEAELRIVRPARFYTRVLMAADVGFAEAYMDGDIEASDLFTVLSIFIRNRPGAPDYNHPLAWLSRTANHFHHWLGDNTVTAAVRNIRAHYDIEELFPLFLGQSMQYSCAVYRSPDETLEDGQTHKLHALLRKIRPGPGDHVLEIGFGFGGLALSAVQATGCRWTGVTLSRLQHDHAVAAVRDAGLEDRIDFRVQDYRTVKGTFDRIVVVEMLENVGVRRYPEFFRTVEALLEPDGLLVLQAITMIDQRHERYLKKQDFVQKHIFPGGDLPTVTSIVNAATSCSNLVVEEMYPIGRHYPKTLDAWAGRFKQHRTEIVDRHGETFYRCWMYYFRYSQAGFAERILNNFQMVLARPGAPSPPLSGHAPARDAKTSAQ